jgi:hypothetical protein
VALKDLSPLLTQRDPGLLSLTPAVHAAHARRYRTRECFRPLVDDVVKQTPMTEPD